MGIFFKVSKDYMHYMMYFSNDNKNTWVLKKSIDYRIKEIIFYFIFKVKVK